MCIPSSHWHNIICVGAGEQFKSRPKQSPRFGHLGILVVALIDPSHAVLLQVIEASLDDNLIDPEGGAGTIGRRSEPMSAVLTPQLVSCLDDADMRAVPAALARAAQRARETAARTGTPLIISKDGKLVEEIVRPSQLEQG